MFLSFKQQIIWRNGCPGDLDDKGPACQALFCEHIYAVKQLLFFLSFFLSCYYFFFFLHCAVFAQFFPGTKCLVKQCVQYFDIFFPLKFLLTENFCVSFSVQSRLLSPLMLIAQFFFCFCLFHIIWKFKTYHFMCAREFFPRKTHQRLTPAIV